MLDAKKSAAAYCKKGSGTVDAPVDPDFLEWGDSPGVPNAKGVALEEEKISTRSHERFLLELRGLISATSSGIWKSIWSTVSCPRCLASSLFGSAVRGGLGNPIILTIT
jgi:hypothetical protein